MKSIITFFFCRVSVQKGTSVTKTQKNLAHFQELSGKQEMMLDAFVYQTPTKSDFE